MVVTRSWRLIDTGPLDPFTNMAVDEALASCFVPASSLPILRLYGWEPPALSLGRFQNPAEALDLDLCRAENVPVVRRMTAGGIIYHHEELTYSIICGPNDLPAGLSVKQSFRHLCGFLIEMYRRLGCAASFAVDCGPEASLGERTPFCYAGHEDYDILIHGKKVGGNAQRRGRKVIFQHGSIPLTGKADAGLRFLRTRPHGGLRATTLLELGHEVSRAVAADALRASFAEVNGVELTGSALSEEENVNLNEFLCKYTSRHWTREGRWPADTNDGG